MFVEYVRWTYLNLVIEYNNKKKNKSIHKANIENWHYAKLLWIPKISLKIKREFKKIGKDITIASGEKWQQILCQKNKPKLLPTSQPGVYLLDCLSIRKYIGKSKKKVLK